MPVSALPLTYDSTYLLYRYIEWERVVRTRIQRWGNSLAVRIPKSFAEQAGLAEHAAIDMSLTDGKLSIERVVEPDLTLEHLLSGVTDENLHSEIETGQAVGNEVW
jgi:antitoxin MazE